jgi:uncharacterized membrane protein (DUF2068 family)
MVHPPPGTRPRRRGHIDFHYELLACGWSGHALVGTNAAEIRPQDAWFARVQDGLRWYRCLRCDAWLPLDPPSRPTRPYPPEREAIAIPVRGKALRDKLILRLIAIDRAFHFVVLGALAVAVFAVAGNQGQLRQTFYRVLSDLQGPSSASIGNPKGTLGRINEVLSLHTATLETVGLVLLGYAVLEGIEAIGLWYQRRWAEYLTFVATSALLPLEVYELTLRVSVFKIVAFVVNVAIVLYLLRAKRLFGIRGGGAADAREREEDSGWATIERGTPPPGVPVPAGLPATGAGAPLTGSAPPLGSGS